MSDIKTIIKNISLLSISQVITLITGILAIVMIARCLGDAEFGKLSVAQSLTGILIVFSDIGLSNLVIREIARNRKDAGKYLTNIALIKILLTVLTIGLIFASVYMLGYSQEIALIVYLIGLSLIINSFSMFIRSIFRAFEKMEYEANVNIFISIVKLILIFIVLYMGYGLVEIAYIYILVEIVNLLLSIVFTLKYISKPIMEIDYKFSMDIIKMSLPFFATIVFSILYMRVDLVILSTIKDTAVVGQYSAACLIIYTMLNMPNVVSFAIFPTMSRMFVSSKDGLKAMINRLTKYSFLITVPILIILILFANIIITVIFGESFSGAIIALQILSLYIPFRFINYVTAYTLSSANKESLRATSIAVAVVFNIIANVILIPRYSLIGSAIAMVLTEAVLFLCYYYFTAKFFYRIPMEKILLKPLMVSVVIVVLAIYFKDANIFVVSAASIAIYMLSLFLLNTFDEYDKDLVKKSISYLMTIRH